MAVTLDTTIAGESANSYITLAEASTYHAKHLYSSIWTTATDAKQKEAVTMASRLLDQWVDWYGYRATEEQALRWPRYDVQDRDGYTFDSDIIPQWLKDATAELARQLIDEDRTAQPDTQGFSQLSLGNLSLTVNSSDRDKYGVLPDAVLAIVEPYGSVRQRGGTGMLKVRRA